MANKNLFSTLIGKLVPRTDAVNEEGAPAYAFTPEHALAQLACTGCLGTTFYATDETQLDAALGLATEVDPVFLAQVALYARREAFMKDMPALLVAVLSMRDPTLFAKVFDRVIDNARMVRTFVQIVRSGRVGRKSLGTRPKKLVEGWLASRSDDELFRGSVGLAPSLADVIKMVHPKPQTTSRRALYAYLVGRDHEAEDLPPLVRAFEEYKAEPASHAVPDVPFQLLTSLPLGTAEWTEIARHAGWQTTRMNLATFARHGVLEVPGMAELVADRLRDPKAIARARVFPYQLLVAYLATRGKGVPRVIEHALQDALELATANVPRVDGRVWIFPDVSSSMQSPVTGHRGGATTAVRCVDVAALVAAAMLRANRDARVIAFDDRIRDVELNPRDTVLTNATKLAAAGGGGTNVSLPLAQLNARGEHADLVIYVSDNESWIDATGKGRGTATMAEWTKLRARCPRAKLVCLDIQPYAHTQAPDREDILNVGGFSDRVFDVVSAFANAKTAGGSHWVAVIRRVVI